MKSQLLQVAEDILNSVKDNEQILAAKFIVENPTLTADDIEICCKIEGDLTRIWVQKREK